MADVDLDYFALTHTGHPTLADAWGAHKQHPTDTFYDLVKEVPMWIGNEDCCRSTFCELTNAELGSDLCWPCSWTSKQRTYTEALALDAIKFVPRRGMRNDLLRGEERDNYMSSQRQRGQRLEKFIAMKELGKTRRKMEVLETKLRSTLQRRSPSFMKYLGVAIDKGMFDERPMLLGLLESIATALVNGKANRPLSQDVRAFYTSILSYGGPKVHELISSTLLGPALSGTRAFRSTYFEYRCGKIREQVEHAAHRLSEYGISDYPCVVGEDGTAIVKRLDVSTSDGKIHVHGTNGPCFVAESLEQVQKVVDERGLANTLYAWVLIPMVEGAPQVPIMIEVHDNSKAYINHKIVRDTWGWLWQEFERVGIKVVGHTFDGDRKVVGGSLPEFIGTPSVRDITIDHPMFIGLKVPVYNSLWLVFVVDCMHTSWRLRIQYLDPERMFSIMGLPANIAHLKTLEKDLDINLLKKEDYDHHDKVNWGGFLRMADLHIIKGVITAKEDGIRSKLEGHQDYYGDYLFLCLMHTYGSLWFIKGLSVRTMMKKAIWCIKFINLWEECLRDFKDANGEKNKLKFAFLTRQTADDVVRSCIALILSLKLFHNKYPTFRVIPDRLSSRFNEYLFAFLRADTRNQNKFSAHGAIWHLKHYDCQLHLEGTTNLDSIDSKRGMPKGVAKICHNRAPEGYWPEDFDGLVKVLVDEVYEEFASHGTQFHDTPKGLFHLLKSKTPEEFMNSPCTRQTEEIAREIRLEESILPTNFNAEPLGMDANEDQDGEEESINLVDAQSSTHSFDTGEKQVLGQKLEEICRKVGLYSEVENEGDTTEFRSLYTRVSELVRQLNSEYQKQLAGLYQKFRGQRFRDETQGYDSDPLNYYSDKDVIAFHAENEGVQSYKVARIERMRTTVSRGRSSMMMPQQRVHVNDENGQFTLRFFERDDNSRTEKYILPTISEKHLISEWPSENIIMVVCMIDKGDHFAMLPNDKQSLLKYFASLQVK